MELTRRRFGVWCAAGVLALVLALLAHPAVHLACTAQRDHELALRDPGGAAALPAGVRDDASHLETSAVAEVIAVPADEEQGLAAVRAALARARTEKLPISIAGARHSMGGQTFLPRGIVLDMLAHNRVELDANILKAQSGATWHDVLAALDPHGLSVAVMQSYNVFSLGGSLSVNAHGWQPDHAPLSSSVRALTLVNAASELVHASRDENAELFSLVLGGYGLFGVILDVELALVANDAYRAERFRVPIADYVDTFRAHVLGDTRVGLAFGRLDVAPAHFLDEAILTVFRRQDEPAPPLVEPGSRELQRLFFQGAIASDYGKELRWRAEELFGGWFFSGLTSRNRLLDDDLAVLANRDPHETEILQEYFVPPEGFLPFVETLRAAVPRNGADLLNVTVRDLRADDDTFLRYADRAQLALVLYFHQERSLAADERMQPLTRELIDAALSVGGRYYLPYRLQATVAQFQAAYPMAARFFALKRHYDPEELFRNRFYDVYGH